MNTETAPHGLILKAIGSMANFTEDKALNSRACSIMNGLEEILLERQRQVAKWGDGDDRGELLYLNAVLTEETGEVSAAVLDYREEAIGRCDPKSLAILEDRILIETIQVAAVCLQIIERISGGTAHILAPNVEVAREEGEKRS